MARSKGAGLAIAVVCVLAACSAPPVTTDEFNNLGAIDNRFIVILADGVDELPEAVAGRHGLTTDFVYRHAPAAGGFAAVLTARTYGELLDDPTVRIIEPDREVTKTAQEIPTGIQRINVPLNPIAAIDGVHTELDIDVAIVDTGIDADHEDLNVAGGINFSTGPSTKWGDGDGHGTHVSGTVAAMDNDLGVVGVAPGARLWAVRVLDNRGSGRISQINAGIDWVAARGPNVPPPGPSEPVIKVANMSLGGGCTGGSCDDTDGIDCHGTSSTMHAAICTAVEDAGVTFVVAAGNDYEDAEAHQPAAFDEVITVSALADTNGTAGGGGSSCASDVDDSFANFSNFGHDVDIMAPGVCIYSSYAVPDAFVPYATLSGTSMASPHVAGAAALYLLEHPNATPEQVKQGLLQWGRPYEMCALPGGGLGDCNQNDPGWMMGDPEDRDPDGVQEPLLYMGVLDESFEGYNFGSDPSNYINLAGGDASVTINSTEASDESESAQMSGGNDPASVKLCLPGGTTASTHLRARFSLMFPSGFVDWNPLIISGDSTPMLYWYWVGDTGYVTEDAVVGNFPSPGVWHEAVIDIDRRPGVDAATFEIIDLATGATLSTATTSLSTWSVTSEPMDCLVVSTWPPNGQDLLIDDVSVVSWD